MNISDSEMVIMRAIWTLEKASVDQISCKIAASNNWSIATIKTLLGRLVKNAVLVTTKSGRKFIYTPTLSECQAVALMGQDLLDKVCAKKYPNVITNLINSADLTKEGIKEISDALAQKTPACHVSCNCLDKSTDCRCHTEQVAQKV